MKCYSNNGEEYSHDSIEGAIEELLSDAEEPLAGTIQTLWEADAHLSPASGYLPHIAESLSENAYSDHYEYAEDWEFSKEESDALQKIVAEAVDKWATETNNHPTFYSLGEPTKFKVRITDEEGGYEIIKQAEGQS